MKVVSRTSQYHDQSSILERNTVSPTPSIVIIDSSVTKPFTHKGSAMTHTFSSSLCSPNGMDTGAKRSTRASSPSTRVLVLSWLTMQSTAVDSGDVPSLKAMGAIRDCSRVTNRFFVGLVLVAAPSCGWPILLLDQSQEVVNMATSRSKPKVTSDDQHGLPSVNGVVNYIALGLQPTTVRGKSISNNMMVPSCVVWFRFESHPCPSFSP